VKRLVHLHVALVLLLSVSAAAVLWVQSLRSQDQLREQVLQQSEQRSLHVADAMAGQVDSLLSTLDLALHQLTDHWLRHPAEFEGLARRVLEALPPGFVSHMVVVNAQGTVTMSSQGDGVGVYLGDRDYFQELRQGHDRVVIGGPVFGRLTKRWLLVVGLPILRNGRFDGSIHLLVPTDWLAQRLAGLQLSGQDVVALLNAKGEFLARNIDNLGAMGGRVAADRPFITDPALGKGVFRSPGSLDQVSRTYGWHRLPRRDAVVVVGLADASVLGPLAPALRRSQAINGLLSLLLLAGGGVAAWLIWRVERSRRAVDASEARLKEAQHLARVGDWTHDAVNERHVWSDEMFRIFGMDPARDTPSYQALLQRVPPEARRQLAHQFNASLKERSLFQAEHPVQRPDGRLLYVRALGVHEFDGNRLLRSVGTVQDITETRSAQRALQRLNDELEQRVQDRTRELAALNRELEAFAYSVSHDLRTPLRSIHGFASLLAEEDERLSSEGRAHLRRIQDAARRMGVLITDLLSMAHHSRAPVHHEVVNLSDLAHAIAMELERGEPQRQVQWAIQDGLVALADPLLMRVVLQNLLGNAWKYTGQTPQARIEFTRTEHAGGQQTFCVRDNGAGFDMAYASQLFQPFKRLHTPQQFEGSGVGLATVQRVIQRHGGQIRGEAAVGQGAAFWFSLPDEPAAQAVPAT
jgi:PAS domain S-box-containing protein